MNKIFNSIFSLKPVKEVKPKRTQPITAAFTDEGEYLGQLEGNKQSEAFEKFPTATVLNIIPVRGKTKVVIK